MMQQQLAGFYPPPQPTPKPCRHHPAEEGQYRELMQQLAGWYSANHERLPRVIWRETSLQHFMLPTGEVG